MSANKKIQNFRDLPALVTRLRDALNDKNYVLLFAFNGTGKTRTSMAFKDKGKKKNNGNPDTLYFNAFTEDLFYWDNDLENDTDRSLVMRSESSFFNAFTQLQAIEPRIQAYLERYAKFKFDIDTTNWKVTFSYGATNNIKVSRGEENIFIWCVFLAICELAIDGDVAYDFVKYIYIDDPISSLDDNNAIAVATDLAKLLKQEKSKVKVVISSHHSLFFNVMFNELKGSEKTSFFLYKKETGGYSLQKTDDTPFFHHVATLSELDEAIKSDDIKTYHFNALRSILEKTATFFGYDEFGKCIDGITDEVLYHRALQLLSHGKYSIHNPVQMGEDNKKLFKDIFTAFTTKYKFELPKLTK